MKIDSVSVYQLDVIEQIKKMGRQQDRYKEKKEIQKKRKEREKKG